MTVGELMDKLKQYDPKTEVCMAYESCRCSSIESFFIADDGTVMICDGTDKEGDTK